MRNKTSSSVAGRPETCRFSLLGSIFSLLEAHVRLLKSVRQLKVRTLGIETEIKGYVLECLESASPRKRAKPEKTSGHFLRLLE